MPEHAIGLEWKETGSCPVPPGSTSTSLTTAYHEPWTYIYHPQPNYGHNCGGPWELQIPATMFNASNVTGGEYGFSAFSFNIWTPTNLPTPADCYGGGEWEYDFRLMVNGTEIVERRDYRSAPCIDTWYYSAGVQQSFLAWGANTTVNINTVESVILGDELVECGSSCEITVEYSNARATNFTWGSLQVQPEWPLDSQTFIRSTTYTAEPRGASIFVAMVNTALGFVYLLSGLASTPLWDPWVRRLSQ